MGRYSIRALPYLNAIADAAFSSPDIRNWLIAGTKHARNYRDAKCLDAEQKMLGKRKKQRFCFNYWCYWCGRDANCGLMPEKPRPSETDMMIFLESEAKRRLAIHIEFKRFKERFGKNQAQNYPLRAGCWATNGFKPASVMKHVDWLTVIFHGGLKDPSLLDFFDRKVSHDEARMRIEGYPSD